MIHPVVVRVTENKMSATVSVTLEQPMIGDGRSVDLGWTGAEPAFAALAALGAPPSAVRDAGELLYTGLSSHDDVRSAIEHALQAGNMERRPLFLDLRVGSAIEALPWETVYVPDKGFLGLNLRWSIGRRVLSAEGKPSGALTEPLRIAAILSCLDVSARDEWEQLAAAVEEAAIPVEVLLFIGESTLRNDLVANTPPWVRLDGIPASATELTDKLRRHSAEGFVPQVLHFFCHGSLKDSPHLVIATTEDWGRRNPRQSSLTLEPEQVLGLTEPTDRPWLVVLNCCLGAAPPGGVVATTGAATHSLARNLVRIGGYPAVVGMREPIDSSDATSFSSCIYRELFAALAQQPVEQAVAPDWSGLLVAARRRLAEHRGVAFAAAAARRKQWTFPVLYVRHTPDAPAFTVTRTAAAALGTAPPNELRIALLREMLAGLGPDSTATFAAVLDANLASLTGDRT